MLKWVEKVLDVDQQPFFELLISSVSMVVEELQSKKIFLITLLL
jgi:hypothetical protein